MIPPLVAPDGPRAKLVSRWVSISYAGKYLSAGDEGEGEDPNKEPNFSWQYEISNSSGDEIDCGPLCEGDTPPGKTAPDLQSILSGEEFPEDYMDVARYTSTSFYLEQPSGPAGKEEQAGGGNRIEYAYVLDEASDWPFQINLLQVVRKREFGPGGYFGEWEVDSDALEMHVMRIEPGQTQGVLVGSEGGDVLEVFSLIENGYQTESYLVPLEMDLVEVDNAGVPTGIENFPRISAVSPELEMSLSGNLVTGVTENGDGSLTGQLQLSGTISSAVMGIHAEDFGDVDQALTVLVNGEEVGVGEATNTTWSVDLQVPVTEGLNVIEVLTTYTLFQASPGYLRTTFTIDEFASDVATGLPLEPQESDGATISPIVSLDSDSRFQDMVVTPGSGPTNPTLDGVLVMTGSIAAPPGSALTDHGGINGVKVFLNGIHVGDGMIENDGAWHANVPVAAIGEGDHIVRAEAHFEAHADSPGGVTSDLFVETEHIENVDGDRSVNVNAAFASANGGEFFAMSVRISGMESLLDIFDPEKVNVKFLMPDGEQVSLGKLAEDLYAGDGQIYVDENGEPLTMVMRSPAVLGEEAEITAGNEVSDKRREALGDVSKKQGFARGFADGIRAGGTDFVTSTKQVVTGWARYVNRPFFGMFGEVMIAINDGDVQAQMIWEEYVDDIMDEQHAVHDMVWKVAEGMQTVADKVGEYGADHVIALIADDAAAEAAGMRIDARHESAALLTAMIIETVAAALEDADGYDVGMISGRLSAEIGIGILTGGLKNYVEVLDTVKTVKFPKDNEIDNQGDLVVEVVKLVDDFQNTGLCFIAGTLVYARVDGVEREAPIEELHRLFLAGRKVHVWARDENTGEQAWKPIVHRMVTHPSELVHLTIGTFNTASSVRFETIVGTPQHPFWVVEDGAFVPMGELEPGNTLSTASNTAWVHDVETQSALPGTTFTAYNFDVADYHTYFVGESGVWVHNSGVPCKLIFSAFVRKARALGGIGTVRGERFSLLLETKRDLSIADIPDSSWGLSSREVSASMLDDFAGGKVDLDSLPTFNDWEQGFFKANRVDSGRKVSKVDIEIHHIIPRKVSELLTDKGALPNNFNPNTVPGHSYTKEIHRGLHDGAEGMNKMLKSAEFQGLPADEMADAVIEYYRDNGFESMAAVAEAWFGSKGVL